MATSGLVILALMVFLAASSGAPSDEKPTNAQGTEAGRDGKTIKVPEECKDQHTCHIKPEGYDELESKINDAVLAHMGKDHTGSVDETHEPDADQAILSPRSDWHNCPSITKRERLYMYQHANETKLVVQTSWMQQYVTTVRCAHEYIPLAKRGQEECFQDLGLSSMGIRSTCKTTFAEQSLYVYDIAAHKVVQKTISVPVCCSCVLSYAFDKSSKV